MINLSLLPLKSTNKQTSITLEAVEITTPKEGRNTVSSKTEMRTIILQSSTSQGNIRDIKRASKLHSTTIR